MVTFSPADSRGQLSTNPIEADHNASISDVARFTFWTGGVGLVGAAAAMLNALAIAAIYGATEQLDAFVVAMTLAMTLPTLYQSAVADPLVAALSVTPDYAREIGNAVATWTLVLGLIVAIVAVVIPPAAFTALFPGLDAEAAELARRQLLLMACVPGLVCGNLLTGTLLNIARRFTAAKVVSILPPVVSLIFVVSFARSWGAFALGAGALVGHALQFVVSGALLRATAIMPRLTRRLAPPGIAGFLNLAVPFAISYGMLAMVPVINRSFASRVNTGGASQLLFAEQLEASLYGLVLLPLVTVMYPHLASSYIRGPSLFFPLMGGVLKICLVLCIPMSGFVMWYAEPIAATLLMRGELTANDVEVIGLTLRNLIYGATFFGVGLVLGRALLAQGRAWVLVWVTPALPVLRFALNAWLAPRMGIAGIGLAGAIQVALFVIACFVLVYRGHFGSVWREGLIGCTAKACAATTGALLVVSMLPEPSIHNTTTVYQLIQIALTALTFVGVYTVLAISLGAVRMRTAKDLFTRIAMRNG